MQEEDVLLVHEEVPLLVQEEDLLLVQEADLPTKFGGSLDEDSTKIGRSFYKDRGPFYGVSTKIGVPKGQIRLPVDAI